MLRSTSKANEPIARRKKYLDESDSIFEATTVGKHTNFLSLSENAKQRAQTAKQRRKPGGIKNARASRKTSILGSLDKFLNDGDCDEEETEATSITRSSFSSDLLSLDSASLANSACGSSHSQSPSYPNSRKDSNATAPNEESQPPIRRRAARRGSVTKYSLEKPPTKAFPNDENESHREGTTNHSHRHENDHSTAPEAAIFNQTRKNDAKHRAVNAKGRESGNRSEEKTVLSRSHGKSSTREGSLLATQKTLDEDDCSSAFTIDQLPLPTRSTGSRRRSSLSSRVEDDDDDVMSIPISPVKTSSRERRRSSISITSVYGANMSFSNHGEDEEHTSVSTFGDLHSPRQLIHSSPSKGRRVQRRGTVMKPFIPDGDSMSTGGATATSVSDREEVSKPLPPPRQRRSSTGTTKSVINTSAQDKGGKRLSLGGMLGSLSRQNSQRSVGSKQSKKGRDDEQSVASQRSEGGSSAGSRRRYQRRGSVTGYSLSQALANVGGPKSSGTTNLDERSTFSEQLPPRAPRTSRRSSTSSKQWRSPIGSSSSVNGEESNRSGNQQSRYSRRGSVTRYNLDKQ